MARDGVVAQDQKDFLKLNHQPRPLHQRSFAIFCRGRNGDRSPPPARIRTYRFPISGSCLRSTGEAERFADSRQLTGQTRLAQCPEVCRAWPSFPWPHPFPPPPPPRGCPLCSAVSPVLRIGPTSQDRSSSACVLGLPDADCLRSQPWDLPVSDQCVSMHAWGLRPRRVLLQHKLSLQMVLPSGFKNAVGTLILLRHFAAQYPACMSSINVPPSPLRMPAYDPRPVRFATPSL